MGTPDQFAREGQSLALSSCGATFASVVLAVIAITAAFPQQFQIFEQVVSFLKVIFCLSILCSLFALFSYLTRESKETVSDVLLYFSMIALVASMFFLIPVVLIFL
jgi:hypothetical protein